MTYHVDREAVIQAPIEAIFNLVSKPEHLGGINPDITVVSHQQSSLGGHDTDWEYSFGAIKLSGRSQVMVYDYPHRLVVDTHGGIPSHWEWQFSPTEEATQTRVSVSLDYEVPGPLQFMGNLLVKRNQQAVEMQMANLKRMAEGGDGGLHR